MSPPLEIDLKKHTTETARWYLLVALDAGRPLPVSEEILWRTLCDSSLRLTPQEVRRELAYLRDRKLIAICGEDKDRWEAELTAMGVDLVEFTIECKPGIARPPKR